VSKKGHIPLRRCVACGRSLRQADLMRFTLARDRAEIVADRGGPRRGRGAYVCASRDCTQRALAKGLLARALRAPAHWTMPDEAVVFLRDVGAR